MISRQLVAFSAPRRCGKKSKSNKYPYFSIYLWLFAHVTRRIRSVTNSSKAPSTGNFKATCCFCNSRTFAPKGEKPQVPVISRRLVAFSAPRRKSRKSKSNKYPYFSIYLWLFAHVTRRILSVTASTNSLKAPSPRDFKVTCCFYRSATLW